MAKSRPLLQPRLQKIGVELEDVESLVELLDEDVENPALGAFFLRAEALSCESASLFCLGPPWTACAACGWMNMVARKTRRQTVHADTKHGAAMPEVDISLLSVVFSF